MDLYRLLPRFWIQHGKSFRIGDSALNTALDKFEITNVTAHETVVGPFTVWISNYPYAFGYNRQDALENPPFVKTRIRLRKAIETYQRNRYFDALYDCGR